ncbi:MAG TPA: hypothetical protein VHB21_00390, partial [Minicystis sp.]|nr:hypothetical protein [Minicystis sp.]
MLPVFFFPAWESDATMRAAIEQSVTNILNEGGETAILSGGDLTFDAKATDPSATYVALAHGFYAHLFDIGPGVGLLGVPADNVEADVDLGGAWQVGPSSRVTLDLRGYLANQLGIRAFDELAIRDPFLQNRVLYTLADTLTYTTTLTKRTSVTLSAGYVQMGAVAADTAAAVGVDMHQGIADATYNVQVTPLDVLAPELRYTYAHYYNALLDLQLDQGPADVQTGTALLGLTHPFGKRFTVTVAGGATVATPPPVLQQKEPVVAPDVRFAATYFDRRWNATLSYEYAYASLGPAIGYGNEHTGVLDIAVRPLDGARYRDFIFHAIARGAAGSSPLSANPVAVNEPGAPPPTAIVYAESAAAGVVLEFPLMRGISFLGGLDLEYTNASFSTGPVAGAPGMQLDVVATGGLAWTLSTDPMRTVRRDPEEEAEDARFAAEQRTMPGDATAPPAWDARDLAPGVAQPGDPGAAPGARGTAADPRQDERDPNVGGPPVAPPGAAPAS